MDPELNLTVKTKFTSETAAHLCCKNGHKDILDKILYRAPEAVSKTDDEGNYLVHALCYVSIIIIRQILFIN